ncbi:hypothetical protein JOD31_001457 [Methylopila capsulata]|uniref:Uncharacterized protein n=1 Tax=Methylopila capsulata TaxID=61654 RepID=A0A9W6IS28_9HYPH|nr:hypothetical protein [Methylopila capsulata]MBM7851232.1 hypothetical protein [Methylopila capsulata]GLK54290.1 hypothetical protein GCM10008170_03090 [Methylopila capsulata]
MSTRTSETTVTFGHPFRLAAIGDAQPAGTYRVVVDEEEILGLSFLAYRRTATTLETPAIAVRGGPHAFHRVDPADLEAALEADGKAPRSV